VADPALQLGAQSDFLRIEREEEKLVGENSESWSTGAEIVY